MLRPLDHLRQASQRHPEAWRMYDQMRADHGKGLPDWPAWCWCPLAGAYAIASQGRALLASRAGEVAILGALGPWRAGQGIYRYDPDIYAAMIETPLDAAIPWDALYRLPEWCLYIETPGLTWEGDPIHGAYVHLEHDVNDGRAELRLLLDLPELLLPVPIHMIPGASIAQGLEAMEMEAIGQAARVGMRLPGSDPLLRQNHLRAIQQIVSLALYTCADEADLGIPAPSKAQPTRTRREGLRTNPPDHPTIRQVGANLGEHLRRAQQAEDQGGTHAGPRPHLRRAHWHSFWVGPRAGGPDRRLVFRWILPMLVGTPQVPGSHPPSFF